MKRQVTHLVIFLFFFGPVRPLPDTTRGVASNGMRCQSPDDLAAPIRKAQLRDLFASRPLSFEPNLGLADEEVRFICHGSGYTLYFTPTKVILTSIKSDSSPIHAPDPTDIVPALGDGRRGNRTVSMKLVGANPSPDLTGVDPLPGKSNYFFGNDPSRWRTRVPNFSKVRYRGVYPGVDWVHYGNQRRLEYDFLIDAGVDPRVVRIAFEGVDSLEQIQGGDVLIHTPDGEIRLNKPNVYQEVNGIRISLDGSYEIKPDCQLGFHVEAFDSSLPLVIDPILSYVTYLGGMVREEGLGIASDNAGCVYVTGVTESQDFPTSGPLKSTWKGDRDVFVSKLDRTGSRLLYSVYVGGSGRDYGYEISVDSSGNAYVAGSTESWDFPVVRPFQSTWGGSEDAFVLKLNPSGDALVYSSFLGGNMQDRAVDIAVDSAGSIFVTGFTLSPNFPMLNPIQATRNGAQGDAFVAKVDSAGPRLAYSTYLGGSGIDFATSVAVDSRGNAYVAGYTYSADFPTVAPFQAGRIGDQDAFVSKLTGDGSALVYSTYVGGSLADFAAGIAVDSSGAACLVGNTRSSDFPVRNAYQQVYQGNQEGFVLKLNPEGSTLRFSTYLGGPGLDWIYAMSLDSSGNVFLLGATGTTNAFISKLAALGASLEYVGDLGSCKPNSIATNPSGTIAYVTGSTSSSNFSAGKVVQPNLKGESDAFVAKVTVGTQIDFAQFANGESWISSFLLANPSSVEEANATISFFDDSGAPLSISLNEKTPATDIACAIPPLGCGVFTTSGIGRLTSGSARVFCETSVSGVIRFSYPGLGITGVGESLPLIRMIMPVVRDLSHDLSTGVAVSNSTRNSSVGFTLWLRDLAGREATVRKSLDLPANGHTARYVEELFPDVDTTSFQGTLELTAYSPGGRLSATAIQLGSSPGQFTTLPVVPVSPPPELKDLVFSQFAVGAGWVTSIFLVNPSDVAVSGQLSFFGHDGSRLSIPVNGQVAADRIPFNLAPKGGAVFTTDSADELISGSAVVNAQAPIGGVLRFAYPSLGIAGVGTSATLPGFITPVARSATRGLSTGIAIASPGASANIDLILRDRNGIPVVGGNARVQLKANGHEARYIEELFPYADTREFEGTLTAKASSGLIAATAIQLGSKPGEFTTMPVAGLR